MRGEQINKKILQDLCNFRIRKYPELLITSESNSIIVRIWERRILAKSDVLEGEGGVFCRSLLITWDGITLKVGSHHPRAYHQLRRGDYGYIEEPRRLRRLISTSKLDATIRAHLSPHAQPWDYQWVFRILRLIGRLYPVDINMVTRNIPISPNFTSPG